MSPIQSNIYNFNSPKSRVTYDDNEDIKFIVDSYKHHISHVSPRIST